MARALVAWMLVATAAAAPAASPRDVVQTAVNRVVAAIQRAEMESGPPPAPRLAMEQRRVEIRHIALELFDLDEISRRALSRYWATRSPAEQAEFVRLFTDLLERAYIGRIEAYSGEKIVYLSETVDEPFATVRSKVITRRSETPLDYRLRLRDGRWKVYDVLIDHVSFVSTYRSEFSRILQKESYAALVARLRKQNLDAAALVRSR
jgi:phospholipid transport system substrate-binding protein